MTDMKQLLVLCDDPLFARALRGSIRDPLLQTTVMADFRESLNYIAEGIFDAIAVYTPLLSEQCPKKIIKVIQQVNGYIPVFFLADKFSVQEAITLVKEGAENCYSKPFALEAIIENIRQTVRDAADHKKAGKRQPATPNFLKATSKAAEHMFRQIDMVADTNFKVIVYGETGTGKESVARRLSEGAYKDRPFVAVDCGCLSKELAASELFGHQKGSFTSATEDKIGAFEQANNGTLFLDEIGNLDYGVQILLLRAIEEKKIRRVGSNKEIDVNVRIIVASNENLAEAVRKGKFREDLFYRLNEFEINIPPLRERMEDLPLFVDFFIQEANRDLNKQIQGVEPSLLQQFSAYHWPGNIRELKNIIRRGCLLAKDLITPSCLSIEFINKMTAQDLGVFHDERPGTSEYGFLEDLKFQSIQAEYETIQKVLKEEKYNKTRTANRLNINRKTLYNKISYYKKLLSVIPKFAS